MGLLAAPRTNDFVASLNKPELLDLARRMESWWAAYDIPLRVPALQFGLHHDAVHTVPIGCRSVSELDELCDGIKQPITREQWALFHTEFGLEVASFGKNFHWYYDKGSFQLD